VDDKGMGDPEGHVVTITDRERVTVSGVIHVDSFDDQEIVLDTDLGTLNLKGEDLHIKQLNLDEGSLEVEGTISAAVYTQGPKTRTGKAKGLLERILR